MPDGTASAIRVFLVDDHSMFRAGVRAELGTVGAGMIEVVGDAGSVSDAISGISATTPDVILLDVHMPEGGGLAVLREGMRSGVSAQYLCLSVSDSAEDVIALIRGGARGYVTKSIRSEELVDAIRRVHSGDAVFSPRLAGYVLDAFSTGPAGSTVTGKAAANSSETNLASAEDLQARAFRLLRWRKSKRARACWMISRAGSARFCACWLADIPTGRWRKSSSSASRRWKLTCPIFCGRLSTPTGIA